MQKYGLYRNEKTHTWFRCRAIGVTVREVLRCRTRLPRIAVARWRRLGRDSDPYQTTVFFGLSDSISEFSEGCAPKG